VEIEEAANREFPVSMNYDGSMTERISIAPVYTGLQRMIKSGIVVTNT
jgi:hypothetical protein